VTQGPPRKTAGPCFRINFDDRPWQERVNNIYELQTPLRTEYLSQGRPTNVAQGIVQRIGISKPPFNSHAA